MPYVCVIGFLNGEMDICAGGEFFPDKLSPEGFLSRRIKDVLEIRKSKSIDDLAYYFILDVKNIVYYINNRIV